MAKFEYSTKIGEYDDPVRLSTSFDVSGEVEQQDYITIKEAFASLEELARKYTEKYPPEEEDEDASA